jgi:hypothetical protein
MNWKKALLVVTVSIFALVFFFIAATGLLATAALGAAAVAISESGVVQAFEEVADGADRLQIDVNDNSVTFTNPDSGESRTVTSSETNGRGRIEFDMPQITITDSAGDSRVIVPGVRSVDELVMPEITITDPDSGQSRVIRPNTGFDGEFRVPRIVWDEHSNWTYDGPGYGLRIVGGIFRGLFSLVALALIAAGAYLLIRNRRQDQVDVDKTQKSV